MFMRHDVYWVDKAGNPHLAAASVSGAEAVKIAAQLKTSPEAANIGEVFITDRWDSTNDPTKSDR